MLSVKKVVLAVALLLSIGLSGCGSLHGSSPLDVGNTKAANFEASQVDTSPLQQLVGVSLNNPKVLQTKLETLSFIKHAEASPDSGLVSGVTAPGGKGHVWDCGYVISNSKTGDSMPINSLVVAISLYDTPKNAQTSYAALAKDSNYGPEAAPKQKTVKVSSDIEAVLPPSYEYHKGQDQHPLASTRFLYTYVRTGNAVLSFFEESGDTRYIGTATGQNLKQLCQAFAISAQ